MAISAFATGVTWRIMYQQDPNLGAVNSLTRSVKDVFNPPGVLSQAFPSTSGLQQASPGGAMVLRRPLTPGSVALLGLTGIAPADVPKTAAQAVQPPAKAGTIVGTVWRDFKPGGGKVGVVEKGKLGLPGVTVELRSAAGKTVQSTTSQPDGSFAFSGVSSGTYRAAIGAQTFAKPFAGYAWLGPKLITPALPDRVHLDLGRVLDGRGRGRVGGDARDVLEAARTDGASEWQVFRRVTVPLLAPVLIVVLVTMVINVLKVFDLVIALAPESTQSNANVIALAMWRTAFGGVNDFGTGSAIAVFLFVLVIPVLMLNIRRFRTENK